MKLNNNFLKKKRSQVTIFLLVGLALLIGVVLLFYLRGENVEPSQLPTELAPIKTYVDECIKNNADSGLDLIGIQGGYYKVPGYHLAANYSNIGYGYSNQRSTLLSISDMEKQLERYLEDSLKSCSNFELFPGFDILLGNITPKVEILPNEVIINTKFPLDIYQEESLTKIEDFRVSVPKRLGYIHSILIQIVSKTLIDPDWIDLTFLSSFDVKIDILPDNNSNIVYAIEDKARIKPYVFLSAFEFKQNLAPAINIIEKIRLVDGIPFAMRVDVTDPEEDIFSCSDDTALFDITEDCVILFTPDVPGSYDVTISVVDIRGNRADKKIIFEVRE